MAKSTGKTRDALMMTIAHQSNRRAAARHFSPARLTLPLLSETGPGPAPEGYLLN
jgi:hypothetical protein